MQKRSKEDAEDEELSPALKSSRNLCVLGNVFLAILSLVTLIVAVLSYTQAEQSRPEELAQCIAVRPTPGIRMRKPSSRCCC